MPTYEYRCERGHTFDRIQKMSDKPVARCPICGAKATRLISGGGGVIFKGSGFYITDYGKDGKGPRKEPDASATGSKSDAAPSDAGAPKADAKPEPKKPKPDAS
ncbi:MAG: FmdB family zinc ribbon protein [Gemmatimonadales bacterium]